MKVDKIALTFCAASLFAAAPVSAQTAEPPQRGGTAIFVLNQDPPTVNPDVTSGVPDHHVGCLIYEGLIEISPDYKILPLLAKSYSISPDGKSYSFELKDVKWTDGKPVTSEDVRYSIMEVAAKFSPTFGPAGRVLEGVETPDPKRVVIKLKESFGPFAEALTCQNGGAILPSHLFKGTNVMENPATLTKPVGTGAFIMDEWKHGDYVRLKRNPNYHVEGKPYLDEVIGKVITVSASRVQALQAGEVDHLRGLAPSEIQIVRANPKLQMVLNDVSPTLDIIFFNTKRKPLDDRRVRQALMVATDRDYLFKNAFFNFGQVGTQPFTVDIPWAANPNIDYRKMYPFDPAKANAMLDEAGMKRGANGKRFTVNMVIWSTDYPEFVEAATAMKSMWQAIGVDVSIEAMERPPLLKRVFQDKDFDITFQNYGSNYDPALGMARTFVTSSIPATFGNASSYSNPEVDALFDKGQSGTTLEERGKVYREVSEILARDLPEITVHTRRSADGATVRLKGLWGRVQSTGGNWADAWLQK